MYSTAQQTIYLLPTAKKSSHPSQRRFDPSVSLKVMSMTHKKPQLAGHWSNNYGRGCWTADTSRYTQNSSRTRESKATTACKDGQRRTLLEPEHNSSNSLTLPATASLPKRGQVQLTSANHENVTSHRVRTVGSRAHRGQRVNELGKVAAARNVDVIGQNYIGELTMADIQAVIDADFPETQGLAFSRASQYIRTATADLMRIHSRPSSQQSSSRATAMASKLEVPMPISEEDDMKPTDPIEPMRLGSVTPHRLVQSPTETELNTVDVTSTAVNIRVPTS